MQEKVDLKLDWCSYKAAKYACEHWHYSRRIPRFKLVKIGVWEDSQFIGVIIFSWGATNKLVNPYNLKMTEGCELTRIALNNHKTEVSKLVKIAIKMLKKINPGLKLIVSFADSFEGHLGKIYQAGNWIYTGETPKSHIYKDNTGRFFHSRNVGNVLKNQITRLKKDCIKIERPPKYRYLYPLTKQMREQIEPLAKPYPKNADESKLETNPKTIGEIEGANPIHPLYKMELANV